MLHTALPSSVRTVLMAALHTWRDAALVWSEQESNLAPSLQCSSSGHSTPTVNASTNANLWCSRPSIIGTIPGRHQPRWTRSYLDIERDLIQMEEQVDAEFRLHVRTEANAEVVAGELARLAHEVDLISLASGLRWLCSGWCVISVAHLIRCITHDWPPELAGALAGLLLEGLDIERAIAVNYYMLRTATPTQVANYLYAFLQAWDDGTTMETSQGARLPDVLAIRHSIRQQVRIHLEKKLCSSQTKQRQFQAAWQTFQRSVCENNIIQTPFTICPNQYRCTTDLHTRQLDTEQLGQRPYTIKQLLDTALTLNSQTCQPVSAASGTDNTLSITIYTTADMSHQPPSTRPMRIRATQYDVHSAVHVAHHSRSHLATISGRRSAACLNHTIIHQPTVIVNTRNIRRRPSEMRPGRARLAFAYETSLSTPQYTICTPSLQPTERPILWPTLPSSMRVSNASRVYLSQATL
jgi:hypothetical protein